MLFTRPTAKNVKGFSLLEVLLGMTVFMIGMLGVTALNISSLKTNTFSGNMSEATILAATKLEELMAIDFDDAVQLRDNNNNGSCEDCVPFVDQDADQDGLDDDGTNFGLDDTLADGVDYEETDPFYKGKNEMFTVYHNVAENEPIPNAKRIKLFVVWEIKGVQRQMSIETIRVKETSI
jgi:type IV pilus assembly protein PilV